MDDMSNNTETPLWKGALETILEAKGQDAVVLDLAGHCSWTDFMIIVTGTSRMHLRGIYMNLLDMLKDDEVLHPRNSKGSKNEEQWILMDCGPLVIQIMTKEAREYYDLESIWFESEVLYREDSQSSSSS